MHSFTLHATGKLARHPEVNSKGDRIYTRLCLVGSDYAGRLDDGTAREAVTTMWLVAFGATAETIAKNCRKGDQLFVQGHIRSNNWQKDGEMQYDHSFVIDGFRFSAPGRAKRLELSRTAGNEHTHMPPFSPSGETSDDLAAAPEPPTALRHETERSVRLS
jgi:single-stranded DNA-binding protein